MRTVWAVVVLSGLAACYSPDIDQCRAKLLECMATPAAVPTCALTSEQTSEAVEDYVWEQGCLDTLDSPEEERCLQDLDCSTHDADTIAELTRCISLGGSGQAAECDQVCMDCRSQCDVTYQACTASDCTDQPHVAACLEGKANCDEGCLGG